MRQNILAHSYKSFLLAVALFGAVSAEAQSVTIFRNKVIVLPRYKTLGAALKVMHANDSLVISADTFYEHDLVLDSAVNITGTITSTAATVINAKGLGRVMRINRGNVQLTDIHLTNGKVNNEAGGGIYNAGSGLLKLTGKSKVTNSSVTGIYANGGGIYSFGQLLVTDSAEVSGNYAYENGGGIYAYGKADIKGYAVLQNNTTDGSGGGLYSSGSASVTISEQAAIRYNTAALAGGGIYTPAAVSGSVMITGNKAGFGGGIACFGGKLYLSDVVSVSNNIATTAGGGLWLNNTNLDATGDFMIMDNSIPAKTGAYNFGGAIYNVDGWVNIDGGRITGNTSPVAAIYNAIGSSYKAVFINNAHIYNPSATGERQIEVYNNPAIKGDDMGFYSNLCWWGSNDLTGLVYNRLSPDGLGVDKWIVSHWAVNDGTPVDETMTSFPVNAYFTWNDGFTVIDTLKLRSLAGSFTATSGKFEPPVANINHDNQVRSVFSAGATPDSVVIMGVVDADTFITAKIGLKGTGVSVMETAANSTVKVYPNPVGSTLNISGAGKGTQAALYSMDGQLIFTKTIREDREQIATSGFAAGMYILQCTGTDGKKMSRQLIKQ